MNVLVTGASGGIGAAIVKKFLAEGYKVYGMDLTPAAVKEANYTHIVCDILSGELPDVPDIGILINNAGVQDSGRDIDVNLKGTIRVTEKYAFSDSISSVLFIASASASTGAEFPEYAASKGGVVSYMKNIALRLAPRGATANSLSPGGVLSGLNDRVIKDSSKWDAIMALTPLRKWATTEEIADWAYFITVINKSMTARDVLVDNGESAKAEFIW